MLIATPIRAGKAGQLNRLNAVEIHQMRAGTEVYPIALLIKANDRILGQIFDQLHFVRFLFFLEESNSVIARFRKARDVRIFLHDFFHFRFDFRQIFIGKHCIAKIDIVVESFFNSGSDG